MTHCWIWFSLLLPWGGHQSRRSSHCLSQMLADAAGESGAKGVHLGLGPQRNGSRWLSLVEMQPVTTSLQIERSQRPRPPKALTRIQDHIQKPSTVSEHSDFAASVVFNFKRAMGDPGSLLPRASCKIKGTKWLWHLWWMVWIWFMPLNLTQHLVRS